jgi:hypothetical protein
MSSSPWRIETLFEHFTTRFTDIDLRQQQRFDAQTKAIDAAMIAQRTAIEAALVAADKATDKAEEAAQRRFESVNEFRATLSDQATTFMTRAEAMSMFERNAERIVEMQKRMDTYISRDAVLAEYDRVTTQLSALSERQTRSEGKGLGLNAGWSYVATTFGIVATIVAAYFAIKG